MNKNEQPNINLNYSNRQSTIPYSADIILGVVVRHHHPCQFGLLYCSSAAMYKFADT